MKFKLIFLTGLLLLNLSKTYALEGTAIKAEVDRHSIALDENVSYKLTIISDEKQIPEPQLPAFSGFDILSRVQSQELSIASGKSEITIAYIYILLPKKEGRLKIEPAKIKISNKLYSSETLEIEVKPGKRSLQVVPAEPKNNSPENDLPESQEPQITL